MSANAQIVVSMRNQADPEVRKLASSFRDLIQKLRDAGATQEQAERKALSHAQALAQLAAKSGQVAAAERTLSAALSQVNRESTAAVRATTQMVGIQNRMATSWGTTALTEFKQGLVGFAAPAAAATAALTVLTGTVRSFKDAFVFKAQLDATTAGINLQLRGVRDVSAVWAQGQAVAERYKLTQAELTSIMQNSVQVLRQSRSGADELTTTLLRLQATAPEKPIEEAARALRELNSGDVTTIKDLFNISAKDARRMKEEIAGGADAVQVLSRFLTDAGSGMEVLEARTKGAVGAMNDLKVAEEQAAFAQAKWAEGPGMQFLLLRTEAVTAATRILNKDFVAMQESALQVAAKGEGAFRPISVMVAQGTAQNNLYHRSLTQGLGGAAQAVAAAQEQAAAAALAGAAAFDQERQAVGQAQLAAQQHAQALAEQTQKTLESKLQTEQMAAFQQTLANLGSQVASGLLTSGEAADLLRQKYAHLGDEALKLINLSAQLAQVDAAKQIAAGQAQVTARLVAQGEAYKKIRDAEEQRIAQTGTVAQKQALLLKQLERARATYGAKSVEAIDAETRLIAFRQQQEAAAERTADRAGKAKIKDAREVLNLTERTADAQERQLRAALDARTRRARRQQATTDRGPRAGRRAEVAGQWPRQRGSAGGRFRRAPAHPAGAAAPGAQYRQQEPRRRRHDHRRQALRLAARRRWTACAAGRAGRVAACDPVSPWRAGQWRPAPDRGAGHARRAADCSERHDPTARGLPRRAL